MIKKLKGFTLGEVLIALSVIGVVASLILPQLVNGQKAATALSQYNTVYSLIAKAVTDMDIDNVSILPESYMTAGSFYPKIRNYFKIAIDCGVYGNTNTNVCFSTVNRTERANYKRFNGTQMNDTELSLFDDGAFVLNNGMLVMIENPANHPNGLLISADINGKNKLPNRLGYDVFFFELTKEGILPLGAPGTTAKWSDDPDKYCNKNANLQFNGVTCAYFATTDQEYFKKVYNGH